MTQRRMTDDLIRQLAASPVPKPFHPGAAAAAMLAVLAPALGLFWLVFGLRADLAGAWGDLTVQAKTVLPALLALAAIRPALRSSRPEGRVALWPLAIPAGLAGAMVLYRLSQAGGARLAETLGQTALACLTAILLLSLPPLLAGLILLRRAAPARPALTGALLGLAAGAAVAAGYALHCTEDSPLFFVLWYGLAIGLVAGCGGWLGQRLLRW